MRLEIHNIILSKRCVVFGYLDGKPILGGGKAFFIALSRALGAEPDGTCDSHESPEEGCSTCEEENDG